ncbi:MAG: hypothetical protein DMD79_12530 [Candidatus Rokuibacteriota bacterium]|nr:MAG: hypothetical protein DMD79_12530 [Candidatus Rokubacteria bacterium]
MPRSGVCVIDVRAGKIVHSLETASNIGELFDLALLPGVRRPMALAFDSGLSRRFMTIGSGAQARQRDLQRRLRT